MLDRDRGPEKTFNILPILLEFVESVGEHNRRRFDGSSPGSCPVGGHFDSFGFVDGRDNNRDPSHAFHILSSRLR